MAECPTQDRWPPRNAPVRQLLHIGPLFEDRFGNQHNVVTLQDLVNFVNARTLRANRDAFNRVFTNKRAQECVARWESSGASQQTKQWPQPWPSPPYRNIRNRRGLSPGNFKYCVRTQNKCAWDTVEAYLRAQQDVDQRRIPAAPARTEYCSDENWCKSRTRRRRRKR